MSVALDREPHLAEFEHSALEGAAAKAGCVVARLCLDDIPLVVREAGEEDDGDVLGLELVFQGAADVEPA